MKQSEQNLSPAARLSETWQSFVLLPGADVPRSGSRTEVIVNPSRCLRVEVRLGRDGNLVFRPEVSR